MANHFRDNTKESNTRDAASVNPNSRAAIRARKEAEEREKQEWIARRKREEKAAAEAEAKEKAAWIAERRRQEKAEEEKLRAREKAAREAEHKRRAEKRAEKARKVLRVVKIALLVLAILAALAAGAGVYGAYRISNSSTNFPNVYINGIGVGGLTKEETEQKLTDAGWGSMESQTLTVKLPMDVSVELDRVEAGLTMDKSAAVEAAFRYGHDQDLLGCVKTYVNSLLHKVDVGPEAPEADTAYIRAKTDEAVEAFREKTAGEPYFIDTEEKVMHFVKGAGQMDLDPEKLFAAVEEAVGKGESELVYDEVEGEVSMPDFDALYKELNVEPVDAHFADKDFEIVEETPGVTFDVKQARKLWLAAEPMEELLIPLKVVKPKVTAEQLKASLFKDLLGSQTSSFGGSTQARVNNINLAVKKINGTVLMPGESFSYNGTVGQRTLANGFEEAAAYSDGEVVQEVGGGICQVSSTLYCATLYARMTTVSRTNHYFRVTYLPLGQDATVSWPGPDFKFRNDREYPVKIVAYCDNEAMEMTIEIWGTDTDGIWVSLSYDQYAVHDTEFTDVVIGSNVYLWITYHDKDGNVLEVKEGSASTYFRHDYEIDWPPEKYNKPDEGGSGGGDAEIIDDGGGSGGGDEGGSGGDTGGGGGDEGGGDIGDVIIEEP